MREGVNTNVCGMTWILFPLSLFRQMFQNHFLPECQNVYQKLRADRRKDTGYFPTNKEGITPPYKILPGALA